MDDTDLMEVERARSAEEAPDEPSGQPPRPSVRAPSKTASVESKTAWCGPFIRWAYPTEALDAPHPDTGVHGHLWRLELSSCLLDPQEYERQIDEELNQHDSEQR